jgi:cell division protein FtsB
MERWIYIIKNKYVIAILAFTVWMLFFDRNDVTTQYQYYSQKKALEREKAYFTSEISRMEKEIQALQSDPNEIQRIAREKYQMKKDNEDVYVILEEK